MREFFAPFVKNSVCFLPALPSGRVKERQTTKGTKKRHTEKQRVFPFIQFFFKMVEILK
jgi:hypothetical protein